MQLVSTMVDSESCGSVLSHGVEVRGMQLAAQAAASPATTPRSKVEQAHTPAPPAPLPQVQQFTERQEMTDMHWGKASVLFVSYTCPITNRTPMGCPSSDLLQ